MFHKLPGSHWHAAMSPDRAHSPTSNNCRISLIFSQAQERIAPLFVLAKRQITSSKSLLGIVHMVNFVAKTKADSHTAAHTADETIHTCIGVWRHLNLDRSMRRRRDVFLIVQPWPIPKMLVCGRPGVESPISFGDFLMVFAP